MTVTVITLSTTPSRQRPATFSEENDTFMSELPTFRTDLINLATYLIERADATDINTTTVAGHLDDVTAAANAFTAQINATKWISGTTYAIGAAVWSPATSLSYRRLTAGAGTTDPSADATNWRVVTNTIFNDAEVRRAMFRDVGYTFVDKGDSGVTAQVIDFSAGTHQRIRATGAFNMSFSNWPPSGFFGEVLLELVADGTARVITFPAGTKFLTSSGAVTTVFSELLVTLQSAAGAIDWLIFFTRDAGTTLYCKVVR